MSAVLDEKDPLSSTIRRDLLDLKRQMTTDVNDKGGLRPVPNRKPLEIGERHTQVIPPAIDELDTSARRDRGERCRHERIRRTQHNPIANTHKLQGRQRRARPTRKS